MKIEVGKKYKVKSIDWMKKNGKINKGISGRIDFEDGFYSIVHDEHLLNKYFPQRVVVINKVYIETKMKYAEVYVPHTSRDMLSIPFSCLYSSLDLLKEIHEKINEV